MIDDSIRSPRGIKILLVIAAITAIGSMVGWYRSDRALTESHRRFVEDTLQPMRQLLIENRTLRGELAREAPAENGADVLEAYLIKIRRDGVANHAIMKERLDQLAANNAAVTTLIKVYAREARTAAFRSQSDEFRDYASAWRDRWNSVMDLYMEGGNYAVATVPSPSHFYDAVDAEIAAEK